MILYVIRHGETAWNKVRRLQGQTDIPLAEEGIRLAKETGIGMKDIPIDLVISSPLQRALQTADCITEGRNIPIVTDERIQEISFGDWEGESLINSTILPADYKKQFYENPLYCEVPPHGETVSQVIQRTADFYQSLLADPAYQDKHILISTHGAAGRCFLCNFFADKTDIWRGGVPKNCAVTTVEVINKKSRIVDFDRLFYTER